MRSIDRKLFRDLWYLRGQALAIALVIVSGVATFVMSLSTLDSLQVTRERFYQDYHFGHVFCSLKRAPEAVRRRLESLPGVDHVETRVVAPITVEVEDFFDPITGFIFSIRDDGKPLLNDLYLRQGRLIEPRRENEIVVSETFAEAHSLEPGQQLRVTVNGRRKRLSVVGIALSPEHLYQIRPGAIFPDYERYAVFWMGRTPLSTAHDMEGAFNDVVLTLTAEAQPEEIIAGVDRILARYGGLGAYTRKDQLSNRYLQEEFRQLGRMARIFPTIFLGVAAFLLNVVLSRLVSTQREQIAVLKAFGYSKVDIGIHYVKMVVVIALIGAAGGIVAGVWLGQGLSNVYMEFYRFPFLDYVLRPQVAAAAAVVTTLAAVLGTLHAVRTAAALPPAEAMRPEPPARFKESVVERLGAKRFLRQPTRMIIRHIERRPLNSLLTITGIGFACAILMVGRFQKDAVDFMVEVQFGLSQRDDILVTLSEPTSRRALHELRNLRGVEHVEGFRAVPVRLRNENRSYRTAIEGVESDGDIYRLLDTDLKPIRLPAAGVVLSEHLGKILGIETGDRVLVEVLEGRRPKRLLEVAGLVKQFIGVSAYMNIHALNRFLREDSVLSGARLALDERHQQEIYDALKEMPRVAATEVRENSIRSFYETLAETLLIFTTINTLLAATIAFGVVYNSARIALSERGRELASLRVLGFTRGEISYILLGELTALTLAAIPLGFIIGHAMCDFIASNLASDLYRVPLVLESQTYAFSATVILVATALSALIVRRKLDHLDLVAVLKTRE